MLQSGCHPRLLKQRLAEQEIILTDGGILVALHFVHGAIMKMEKTHSK